MKPEKMDFSTESNQSGYSFICDLLQLSTMRFEIKTDCTPQTSNISIKIWLYSLKHKMFGYNIFPYLSNLSFRIWFQKSHIYK